MSMINPLTAVTAGLGATSTILGMGQEQRAAEAREQALKRRQLQDRLQSTQESIQRSDKLDEIMSSQVAHAAASGITLGSGSVKALSEDSYNRYLQDERNAALNLEFRKDAINEEIASIRAQARSGLIGGVARLGFQTGSILRNDIKSRKLGS